MTIVISAESHTDPAFFLSRFFLIRVQNSEFSLLLGFSEISEVSENSDMHHC